MKDGNSQTAGSSNTANIGGAAIVASQSNQTTTGGSTFNNNQPILPGQNLNITPARKSSPLKWILLIGLPILLIIICVLVWYFAFFNNKYNVVRQALYSMMDNREDTNKFNLSFKNNSKDSISVVAEGQISYLKNNTFSGNVTATIKSPSLSTTLPQISYAMKDKTVYVKVKLNEDAKSSNPGLTKIDGQWIKIDLSQATNTINSTDSSDSTIGGTINEDLGTTSTDSEAKQLDAMQKCFTKANDKLDEKPVKKQLVDALLDTKFVTVDDSKSDSKGKIYQISLDDSKAGDFIDKFGQSDYYKTMADCAKSEMKLEKAPTIPAESKKSFQEAIKQSKPVIKLWVRGLSREVKQIQASSNIDENNKVTVTTDFAHKKPSISMPNDAQDIQKVIEENPELLQGIMQGVSSIDGSGSSSNPLDNIAVNQSDDASKRDVSSVVSAVASYTGNTTTSLGNQVVAVYSNGKPVTSTPLGKYIDLLSSSTDSVYVGPVTANPADLPTKTIWVLTGGKCDSTSSFSAANSDKQYVVLTRLSNNNLYCQDAS